MRTVIYFLLFMFVVSLMGLQAVEISKARSPAEPKGIQELKTLKTVNIFHNIFDNYSTGSLSPFE